MTYRFLTEPGSEVQRLLATIDPSFPEEVGLYINKESPRQARTGQQASR